MIRVVSLPTLTVVALCTLAGGCKKKPAADACIAESGAKCDERYGVTPGESPSIVPTRLVP